MPTKAEQNYLAVTNGLGLLQKALRPFIEKHLKAKHKQAWWNHAVLSSLSPGQRKAVVEALKKRKGMETLDAAAMLTVLERQWNYVFKDLLSKDCRSYTNELMGMRNKWAHGNMEMGNDDAWRALDTMTRLVEEINAPNAKKLRELADQVRQPLPEKKEKTPPAPAEPPIKKPVKAGGIVLKPWYEVAEPNPDVAKGEYTQAEFVADLSQVARGKATVEYQDPVEFFNRTYLTEGMKLLLTDAIKRVTGKGGQPVFQIKTAFGGGKTHAMLALYHLFGGKAAADELEGIGEILKDNDASELPHAKIAVLVGTALDVAKPRIVKGLKLYTLWGEMAYQLGGSEGYEMVREADESGTSPGSQTMDELFDRFGPCVILIDELVAYVRDLYRPQKRVPAGNFDSNLTFVQSLTEAVAHSKNSILVASLPESSVEIGGEGGQAALDRIEQTFGRIEAVWKPITAMEGFEIVRRRLFRPIQRTRSRDAVCRAFATMYRDSPGDFPQKTLEGGYLDRLKRAYPIHPDFFDRLYDDWSTLERFQRTRGVLRLMANVIYVLEKRKDGSLLIMPGSLPMDQADVSSELIRYLEEEWNSVVDGEVGGENSEPARMDRQNPRFGRRSACQRVANTIFLGSAPTLNRSLRGIVSARIRLGVIQPNDKVALFNDALTRLRDSLSYLYHEQDRYWYDTTPNLRRVMRDIASGIKKDRIEEELLGRLRGKRGRFPGVHVGASSGDIPDEREVRLVLISPLKGHTKNSTDSPALDEVREILENRGTSPRLYKNSLVFAAVDQKIIDDLIQETSVFRAWKQIYRDRERRDLKPSMIREIEEHRDRSDELIGRRLHEAYVHALVPSQKPGASDIVWQEVMMTGSKPVVEKAFQRLKTNEALITDWAPVMLKQELDRLLWKDRPHIGVREIWEFLFQYPYLPRILNGAVLQETIQEGVRSHEFFGYAARYDEEEERYIDLSIGETLSKVYLDRESVLVKTEIALKQKKVEAAEDISPDVTVPPSSGPFAGFEVTEGERPGEPVLSKNFFGSVDLKSLKMARQVSQINEEIIHHLTNNPKTTVKVSLEIEATAKNGIPEEVKRILEENCRTLKFKSTDFD